MPVVRHQREAKQSDAVLLKSVMKHPQERLVIFRFVKDRLSLVASIEGVVNLSSAVVTALSGHDLALIEDQNRKLVLQVRQIDPRPVLFAPVPREESHRANNEHSSKLRETVNPRSYYRARCNTPASSDSGKRLQRDSTPHRP